MSPLEFWSSATSRVIELARRERVLDLFHTSF
jgi:hypothetical protein